MPAGPSIRASRPCPSRASASAPRSTRSSRSRSTISSPGGVGAARRGSGRPAGGPGTPAGAAAVRAGASSVRRLGEHLGLQRPQRRAGVDAELVGQRGPGPPQRGQRVGLPVRPVERQHEQPPALLAHRVVGHQALDLGHQDGGLALAEPGRDQLLAGHRAQPGQPGHLGVGPRPRRRGRRTPGRATARAPPPAAAARAGGSDAAGLPQQPLEPPGVHGVRRRPAARSRGRGGRSRSAGPGGRGPAPSACAGARRRPAGRWWRSAAWRRPRARRSSGRPARRRRGPAPAGRARRAAADRRARAARRPGWRPVSRARRPAGRPRRPARGPRRCPPRLPAPVPAPTPPSRPPSVRGAAYVRPCG